MPQANVLKVIFKFFYIFFLLHFVVVCFFHFYLFSSTFSEAFLFSWSPGYGWFWHCHGIDLELINLTERSILTLSFCSRVREISCSTAITTVSMRVLLIKMNTATTVSLVAWSQTYTVYVCPKDCHVKSSISWGTENDTEVVWWGSWIGKCQCRQIGW